MRLKTNLPKSLRETVIQVENQRCTAAETVEVRKEGSRPTLAKEESVNTLMTNPLIYQRTKN